jgi:hypothetical protein
MRVHTAGRVDEAIDVGKSFHVNRIDWTYRIENGFVDDVHAEGWTFGGAINNNTSIAARAVEDVNGDSISIPWLSSSVYRGCVNKISFKDEYKAEADLMMGTGLKTLQQDDTGGNYSFVAEGGCYCAPCQTKATGQGYNLSVEADMLAFQEQSMIDFYFEMHTYIENKYGAKTFTCNGLYTHSYYAGFDGNISEISEILTNDPGILWDYGRTFSKVSRSFAITAQDDLGVDEFRLFISRAYAAGITCFVPWDQYLHEESYRYYGDPADYADIYGFIRANSHLYDYYEDAFISGFTGFTELVPHDGGYQIIDDRFTGPSPIIAGWGVASNRMTVLPGPYLMSRMHPLFCISAITLEMAIIVTSILEKIIFLVEMI